MNPLEIDRLSKTYRGKRLAKVAALSDLSLQVGSGEVFGFLGPNGAGKSTTIKSIMGFIRPDAGTVTLFGKPVQDPASHLRVGYLPENPSFYDFLSAREYLRFVGRAFGMDAGAIASRSAQLLELLDLAGAADRPMRGYSKGMVQRLGLAQAMLHDPDLYILDEPMSGLDPVGRSLVKEIIRDLKRRGKTVFFSTHITADVEVVCDRVGIVVGGRLRAIDSVANILQSGLEGYLLQVTRGGAQEELQVEKAQLQQVLSDLVAAGATIDRIEPQRKDMEAFLLEILAHQHDDRA
ncbi:ABC transporter ATP-binding protein [Geomonas subterranea]|uniref:ABC transporter ATP-binding protein n=1 Tax=Geomonas subterranea TaxID=2847989 RepID=A0ABX8LJY4_9BACT|nr:MULTISPECIES: ABC transporter ATP-binding protein [Geomonas]QXE92343.1 ABC transporter ATP-binding protein [Geomonas subterranea]QXM09558.1 ABC transporter ATP-binding protein [Geomonas subterranea]